MRLFLHIIISENPPLFNSKWSGWVKAELRDVKYFDVDQHSEMFVMDTSIKAIEEAEQIFVYIDCDQSSPNQLLKVIKKLSNRDCQIYCSGKNSIIEKLSGVFGDRWQGDLKDHEIMKEAKSYFKA